MNKRKIKKRNKKNKLLDQEMSDSFRLAINCTLFRLFKKSGFLK